MLTPANRHVVLVRARYRLGPTADQLRLFAEANPLQADLIARTRAHGTPRAEIEPESHELLVDVLRDYFGYDDEEAEGASDASTA